MSTPTTSPTPASAAASSGQSNIGAARARLAYGIPEVCRLTGLGRTSVYSAIKSRRLIARRFGRRTVILEQDLLRFLNELPQF